MVTTLEVRLYKTKVIELNAIRFTLVAHYGKVPSIREVTADLGWSAAAVKKVLNAPLLLSIPGPKLVEITPEELAGQSIPTIRKKIRRAVIIEASKMPAYRVTFDENAGGSNGNVTSREDPNRRAIAKDYGISEKEVRRTLPPRRRVKRSENSGAEKPARKTRRNRKNKDPETGGPRA